MKNCEYCLNCETEQSYSVKEEKRKIRVKDLVVSVLIKRAFCDICGEEVFPYEISKHNDKVVFDEYRKQKGLLTSEEIKNIRAKRNMSQIELARFINCGEKNIARYENGTIQDPVFDSLIRMVGDDACYEAMKWFKNKETIPNLEIADYDCSYTLRDENVGIKVQRIKGGLSYGANKTKFVTLPC